MRGLFTKIFLGFWIAQSLTFVISTMLILRHHFVRPSEMMEVLNSTLPSAGTPRRKCIRDSRMFGVATVRRIHSPDDLSGR